MNQKCITVIALGSLGDVQPLVALGKGLRSAGHKVKIATNECFANLVKSNRLDFRPLSGDFPAAVIKDHETFAKKGGDPIAMTKALRRIWKPSAASWAEEGMDACQDADLVIANFFAEYIGASFAEKLNIPFVRVWVVPGALVSNFSIYGTNIKYLFLQHVMNSIFWQSMRKVCNHHIRPDLGLKSYPWYGPQYKWRKDQKPVLFPFSNHVMQWPNNLNLTEFTRITGYWFPDSTDSWQPPADLLEFLEEGEKPIYIGFGSQPVLDTEYMNNIVLKAIQKSGKRAIVQAGFGGTGDIQKDMNDVNIFPVDFVPFDWLFPKVEMAVHHGGAGTTALAARAGIPSIVTYFLADQPFWGEALYNLDVAPAPIPLKNLTSEILAESINLASDESMQKNAHDLGIHIRSEDGISNAIMALKEWNLL